MEEEDHTVSRAINMLATLEDGDFPRGRLMFQPEAKDVAREDDDE